MLFFLVSHIFPHATIFLLVQHPKTVCWPAFASLGVSAVGVTVAVALMMDGGMSRRLCSSFTREPKVLLLLDLTIRMSHAVHAKLSAALVDHYRGGSALRVPCRSRVHVEKRQL